MPPNWPSRPCSTPWRTPAEGDRIEIRGFGSFGLNDRPPRMGRNPKTGEKSAGAAKARAAFQGGQELRERADLIDAQNAAAEAAKHKAQVAGFHDASGNCNRRAASEFLHAKMPRTIGPVAAKSSTAFFKEGLREILRFSRRQESKPRTRTRNPSRDAHTANTMKILVWIIRIVIASVADLVCGKTRTWSIKRICGLDAQGALGAHPSAIFRRRLILGLLACAD